MSTALQTLTQKLASRFEIEDGSDLMETLKQTAFKGDVTDSQMTALLIVANQYGLNPWTKEVYAFPDSNNGIVPIVGVDGWSRILNENPQFDGMDFDLDDEKCTCRIYRKDRSRPVTVTEYMSECYRPPFKGVSKAGKAYEFSGPWQSHPKRMLRHKAMIQCARLAFGFTGIYDQDEAERITEDQRKPINVTPKPTVINTEAVTLASDEQINIIKQLQAATNTSDEKLLAFAGAESIEQIPPAMADRLIKKLNITLDQQSADKDKQAADDNLGDNIPL